MRPEQAARLYRFLAEQTWATGRPEGHGRMEHRDDPRYLVDIVSDQHAQHGNSSVGYAVFVMAGPGFVLREDWDRLIRDVTEHYSAEGKPATVVWRPATFTPEGQKERLAVKIWDIEIEEQTT